MNHLDRMFEIGKLIIEKKQLLFSIDMNVNVQEYQQICNEIIELKNELKDLKFIGLADTSFALEQSDKRISVINDKIDFNSLEPEQYLALSKLQNFTNSIIAELDDINAEINKHGKENIDEETKDINN